MSNVETTINLPIDGRMHPVNRGMGEPFATPEGFALGSDTKFVDVFDLTILSRPLRAFIGILVRNPSASSSIIISIGPKFSEKRNMIIGPQQYLALDKLTFGKAIKDESGKDMEMVRAKLSLSQGTPAAATIGYGVSAQPSDQQTIDINGKVYEFSNDNSKEAGSDVLVPIGASADDSYNNLASAIEANEQALSASNDTGADLLTLTSNYGGAYGDGLVIADGATPTGAVFSGNTAGGSGGVLPDIMIW